MTAFTASKEVFHDGPENASYYTADGCGVAITGGENITVEDAGGKEQNTSVDAGHLSENV